MQKNDKKAKELGAIAASDVTYKDIKTGEEKTVRMYFRRPTRQELKAVVALTGRDPLGADEMLLSTCLLKEVSDESVLENDAAFMALREVSGELIEVGTAKVVKL